MTNQTIHWQYCFSEDMPVNEISVVNYPSYDAVAEYLEERYDAGREFWIFSYYHDEQYDDYIIVEKSLYVVGSDTDDDGDDYETHMRKETRQDKFV
jgi:hypothetical protein